MPDTDQPRSCATRHLNCDGCSNVRDLGGMPTSDGRETRWVAVVRADGLDRLSGAGSVMRRVLRQPLPAGFAPEPFSLDSGPFGAFSRSRPLSDDGRIVAVETPGHAPGHVSVICVDDVGDHVMLAGDATDTLEQLHALRADAIAPDPKAHVATLETILTHCALHPTVYLPSHDPESVARLAGAVTVDVNG